jgi:hypothetical protein
MFVRLLVQMLMRMTVPVIVRVAMRHPYVRRMGINYRMPIRRRSADL